MFTRRKNAGFTLIELLVVIVILGILGTIGFANFRGYFTRALDAERKAVVSGMASIFKVEFATNFSPEKFKPDGTTDQEEIDFIIDLFEKNDYNLAPVKGAKCYYYGYTTGGTASPSDNHFVVLSELDGDEDINGVMHYGSAEGTGAYFKSAVAEEIVDLATNKYKANGGLGCGADGSVLSPIVNPGGTTWQWYKIESSDTITKL